MDQTDLLPVLTRIADALAQQVRRETGSAADEVLHGFVQTAVHGYALFVKTGNHTRILRMMKNGARKNSSSQA